MRQKIGNTLVVNPGSVGQPRNRKPGAQWALYDTESKVLEFFNESYECSELVEECRVNSPQLPYLAEILTRT